MVAIVSSIRKPSAETAGEGDPKNPAPNVKILGADRDETTEQSNAWLISTGELYANLEGVSSDMRNAIRLLSVGTERLEEALGASRRQETVAADDALQRFQGMLPELFCLRSLGDGYGMIINALLYAFENLEGTPLTESQINAVVRLVKKVRTELFLNINIAAEAITALESAGLVVEPRELDVLADLLDG